MYLSQECHHMRFLPVLLLLLLIKLFEVTPSTVKGHPEAICLKNAFWLPNLFTRTPARNVVHCCGQYAGVSPGKLEINLLRNALWPPNLIGITPDLSIMYCWVKGRKEVIPGQRRVTMLRWNAIRPPNLVKRTSEQSKKSSLLSKVTQMSTFVNFKISIKQTNKKLTAHNWQKWKRVFLTCPCHEIYRYEAVGLKSCKCTWQTTIHINMWNFGQFRENLIFCQ